MSTVLFRRPARRSGPELPTGDLNLQEPPELPEPQMGGARQAMTALPMALMAAVMMIMFLGNSRGPMTFLMAGMMMVAMGGMAFGYMAFSGAERKQRTGGDRRDYMRYLSQHRKRVRRSVSQQRDANTWRHPDPASLWSLAMTTRRWERRPTHPDFLEVRIGTAEQRLATKIAPLQTKPVEDLEPLSAKSLRRFVRAYATISDQPVALFLRGFSQIRVGGDRAQARSFVRALVAQVVTFHAPDEVRIGLCLDDEGVREWEWMKWLPHAQHPGDQDAAGAARLVADTAEGLESLLGEGFAARTRHESDATASREEPFVLIVRDGGRIGNAARLATSGYRNALLVDLDDGSAAASRGILTLRLDGDDLHMVRRDRVGTEVRSRVATPDRTSTARAAAIARVVSPYRLSLATETGADSLKTDFDLGSLLQIPDIAHLDLGRLWSPRSPAERLRVAIGVDAEGVPVELDIKESAQGGSGPHGMLIGATGSGKSELLRTLVLALATTHSSETLNFVLVDFKGGATFLGLDRLPHTSALITNLADEAALVGRMQDALHGELVRRQELLRQAGGFASVLEYERARAQGEPLDPLPTLFVVVDEFSELLNAHREFVELFVMIGRLGRSLGVHLLLASQRLDDGRIGQLESHLSYRIGLRTFSAIESRAVIGVPDAYQLPPAPGNGYLRTDVSTMIRFRSAYVSGTYREAGGRVRADVVRRQVIPYRLLPVAAPDAPPDQDVAVADEQPSGRERTVMAVMVDQLVDQGPPAHQVWLPPLDDPPTLDHLLPALVPDPDLGLRAVDWPGSGRLAAPVGFVDKPFEQLRDLLEVDLAGTGGHVGIAGGPRSGKTTLLRTLLCSLALTHSPREVQFYLLDFGGGGLAAIADLPHVGSIAGRLDSDRVSRTVAEVNNLVTERERRFAALGVDGIATYREGRAAGEFTDDPYGDVFLVVDGWFTLRQEYEAAELVIRQLAARGLNFGVHLILTTARWSELHHTMRDQIGTRLELRLGDPVDSAVDLRLAATVPASPGRGLTENKLHFLAALPRIDGSPDGESATEGARSLATLVGEYWSGDRAPTVRTLPAVLPAADLPPSPAPLRLCLGIDETRMDPVWHDLSELAHLTVLGDAGSGKSNLLRHVAHWVTDRFSPDDSRILAVDYRRALFDDVPEAYRLGYAITPDTTRAAVLDAVAGLRRREPDTTVTPELLRSGGWWDGPRLFVLVDDYDMLAGNDSPLSPLVPFLAQGAYIGLHLVLTRGAANVMRMSMDQLIRRLAETNAPDVVLSCPPSEGPVLGNVKPRLLPPGRALLCTRRGGTLIQTPMVPAAAEAVGQATRP
ncbi:type VII secretion protein EccCa [Micromonospora sp. NPDC093277]|uniref:type VII secretion protein EccCa n=1 Tax=Micromonospora sp. NPDC093277 TaxID=3364291 RepID=UPI003804129F